jgi:hypothetical protein
MNYIDQIVINLCESNSIKYGEHDLSTITKYYNLEYKDNVLGTNNWSIVNSSGNQNDCMIHSLLTSCSNTFRKLNYGDEREFV